MYDLVAYEMMLADVVRADAYLAAIAGTVRDGDVVVEIGTGVGYFAVAAVRAGARHVYAIETSPVVALGPSVAAANNCADRITFIPGDSREVTLPGRADVLLADLRATLPLFGQNIPSIIDARDRFLRPGARLVTRRDVLWAVPIELGTAHSQHHLALGPAAHGILRDPVDRAARSCLARIRFGPDEMLSVPAIWGTVDFETVTSPDIVGSAEWTVKRDGRIDGVGVWFDAELGAGAGFSNAPGTPPTSYGRGLFPLRQPAHVEAGDRVRVAIRAKLVDTDYIFAWDTTIVPASAARTPVALRQSTLDALTLRPGQLSRRRADHRPALRGRARALAELVDLADGSRTFEEIARLLHERYSAMFPTERDALRFATERGAVLEDEDEVSGRASL
ncbi:MAG: class I SAM-dependent methyltransferase [Gemmatimonadota bacterium]|nr:class I SAM-dependent methyltransferase [Gemmatimonadota bacterium]